MQLRLVVPDLHLDRDGLEGADTGQLPRLSAVESLLRFGLLSRGDAGWPTPLAAWAGRPELAAVPAAALVAAAEGIPLPASAWFASPVHQVAGLDHLRLHPAGLLRLDPAEAVALAADFANTFGADGLALRPLAGGFLLTGLGRLDATAIEPARLLGADLRRAPPIGPDAAVLRRLGAEIEMWLHARTAAAPPARRLPPNALWLWGGGLAPADPLAPLALNGCDGPLHAEDPTAAALWRLGGGEVAPLPTDFAALAGQSSAVRGPVTVCLSVAPRSPADRPLDRLETGWVAPALAALRGGQLASLSLYVAGRGWQLRRPVGWRFWRRSRPWWEVLAT